MQTKDRLIKVDNVRVYIREWKSEIKESQNPQIILIHGLGEHCSRYDSFFAKFASMGVSAWGFDLPGHGDTLKASADQKPGHIISLELIFKIVDALYDEAKGQGSRMILVPIYFYPLDGSFDGGPVCFGIPRNEKIGPQV
jgi:alpha-beta hydrolase superfamily lysophospholipase